MTDNSISKRRIQELRRRAKREELLVLVWGPGDPGPKGSPEIRNYWEKRLKIRDSIQAEYASAEVRFSEDAELRNLTGDLDDVLTEELLHSSAADCILVLDVSRGAHVEVDRYSQVPNIADKMTVFIPDQFVGSKGLVGEVHKRLKTVGFSEEEFASCNLATTKAIRAVDVVAIQRLIKGHLSQFL